MKKTFSLLLFSTAAIYLTACDPQQKPAENEPATTEKAEEVEKPVEKKPVDLELETTDIVPLSEATTAIQNYACVGNIDTKLTSNENNCNIEPTDMTHTQAFTIGRDDLLNALGVTSDCTVITEFNSVRCYMGIDNNAVAHLYIVPVDQEGHDVIPEGTDNQQYVYDLVRPCPNTCDMNSPLYEAYQAE
ncbi:MAG: hypothetical protein CL843_16140 [Crocinitomicaceae bacterium]|nr:hypothetical protein [Crocinitomicaceae bacterium]|tara:strand:+ start:402 stop:968 length:567 start_codon:yes stop_codon:yes gene_type:complete